MATAYLNRSVSGNNNSVGKWTFSCWVKRTELGNTAHLFNFYTDTNNRGGLRFNSDDTILYYEVVSGSTAVSINTNAVFRDVSAWYHIVLEVDKTISTPDTKIYVNGTSQTFQTDSDYTQNESTIVNSNTNLYINSEDGSSNIRDQILTHMHYIDGTAYNASTFGETDSTSGIWKPKTAPSVTYGTNGFFLKFENSGAMGTDSSGNSNTFTVNGTLTQNVDTPSNVFATLNSIYKAAYQSSFTNGNLTATTAGAGNYYPCFSTFGVETGKWYAEFKPGAGDFHIGISSQSDTDTSFNLNDRYIGETSKSVGVANSNGSYYIAGSPTSYGSSYSDTHIIGVALDMTNKKLYVSKDGTFYNSGNPASGSNGIDISGILSSGDHAFFAFTNYRGSGTGSCNVNFGSGFFGTTAVASANADANGFGAFEYAVPSGYYALCTKNIKEFG